MFKWLSKQNNIEWLNGIEKATRYDIEFKKTFNSLMAKLEARKNVNNYFLMNEDHLISLRKLNKLALNSFDDKTNHRNNIESIPLAKTT